MGEQERDREFVRGGPLSLEEFRALAKRDEVDTIVCAVPDLYGRLMGKRLTPRSFERLVVDGDGVHACKYFFGADIELEPMELPVCGAANGYPDFRMVPDINTLRRIPWEPSTALVLCDAFEDGSEVPVPVAPRSILRGQLERADALDLELTVASELEFVLAITADAGASGLPLSELRRSSQYRVDYDMLEAGRIEWFIRKVRLALDAFGIPVEAYKPEWGLGQHEITIEYASALEMADRHTLFKYTVKELACREGLTASFMAKPGIHEVGSSCHLHVSLRSKGSGSALGWDGHAEGQMSETFAQFLAGQLRLSPDVVLLWAPTVNSYKRFTPNAFAGTTLVAGRDNRSCAFRVVGDGESFRMENRIPGADVNPYHAIAGVLAAGIYGIENELPAPSLYVGNAYADPALKRVWTSLHEAEAHFRSSREAQTAFGEEVHAHLADCARVEVRRFEGETVTDWEMRRYFARV